MCQTLHNKTLRKERHDEIFHSKLFVHSVPFIVSPNTVPLYNMQPLSAGTIRDNFHAKEHGKGGTLYIYLYMTLPNMLLCYVNVSSNVPRNRPVHVSLEQPVCFNHKGVRIWRD